MKKMPKQKLLSKQEILKARKKISKTYVLLEKHYPDAHCALHHQGALQLLVATILSAQCTDERVNMVTPLLFKRFPDAQAFAEADLSELEQMVRSTGFYRNKAKNIQQACRIINSKYGDQVPSIMEELLELPGVARKTANVVLWNAYGKNEGVVVDTHVGRLSRRLGWTAQENPGKAEADLIALVPRKNWGMLSHLLIFHGRAICKSQSPACGKCFLNKTCPSAEYFLSLKK